MNFYKRYMADYARKTSRLTLAQHGAYTLLLDEIYSTEQPLSSDVQELYRVCRAMTRDEQAAVRFVADTYFPISENGSRYNPRASIEMNLAASVIEAARFNGSKGGRPKKETQEKPSGFPKNNPMGFQDETKKETQEKPNGEPSGFETEKLLSISEEYQEAKASLSKSSISPQLPDCPHEDIIDLFAKMLPSLPQPRKSLWRKGKNAPALKARWRWVLTEKYESGERSGKRMASTKNEALDWFGRFFDYVGKSDFLIGKSGTWKCDLAWLVNQANFEKVLSGVYENKVAA